MGKHGKKIKEEIIKGEITLNFNGSLSITSFIPTSEFPKEKKKKENFSFNRKKIINRKN
jgi:hypothetical protein